MSLSGFNIAYHGDDRDFTLGIDATGGTFVADNWLVLGRLGWQHQASNSHVQLNAGVRYYFKRNGVFTGCGLQWERVMDGVNYAQLTPEVGYCFYVNHFISLEPSVYAHLGLNDFNCGSAIGLRLGVGFYF